MSWNDTEHSLAWSIIDDDIHAVGMDQRVNCTVNWLAEMNRQSCTAVVRAAASFFLKSDTFQEYCNSKGY